MPDPREDFERRLLALVRDQMDNMDSGYPNGWEITEFVVTARYYTHHPEDELTPWDGGPYPGWGINGWTRGSSPQYWHDAELLQDALSYTLRKQEEVLDEAGTEGHAGDDEAAEEGED